MITRNDLEIYYGANENLIYHYTNFNSALSILCGHFLIMSPLSNMNDPLEFNNYINSITYDDSLSSERASIILSELEEAGKNRQNHVRILSFSKSFSVEKEHIQSIHNNYLHQGWARSRMWAQYANNNEGVCLVFNKDKCINAAKKMNDCSIRAESIKYTNDMSSLEEAMSPRIIGADSDKDFSNYFLENEKLQYLFQKCEDYSSETEFRIIAINNKWKNPNVLCYFDFEDSLEGIILGKKIPAKDIKSINNILASNLLQNKVAHFKIYWQYGNPRLSDIVVAK